MTETGDAHDSAYDTFDELSPEPKRFLARGEIGHYGTNMSHYGQLTYICETGDHWYQWGSRHRAMEFATASEALAAAALCKGPWFNAPQLSTVIAVELPDEHELRRSRSSSPESPSPPAG